MRAYYNEHDPRTAAWLRALIQGGQIAPGDVDERSIVEVTAGDLHGYTQCHFFAGIGGWSYALRLAGWADDDPVWTGSCPCQSFSASGKRRGFDDPRHLWPAWCRLVRECRPHVVFGEQVASKDGLAWLDVVSADLEGAGYAVGACDLCAAGVGAPHIRQRLFFVAESDGGLESDGHVQRGGQYGQQQKDGRVDRLADSTHTDRRSRERGAEEGTRAARIGGRGPASGGQIGPVADTEHDGGRTDEPRREAQGRTLDGRPGPVNGFWAAADWIACTDGKSRPVEPGSFPLADGVPARLGRLRGYGNAIVPQAAQAFIEAYRAMRTP